MAEREEKATGRLEAKTPVGTDRGLIYILKKLLILNSS